MTRFVVILAIIATLALTVCAMADTIQPLGITNKSLGGGDFGDVANNKGQRGVDGGVGMNNIGLLVRTWGRVTHVDELQQIFYIDDGSGINDLLTVGAGVRVSYSGLATGNSFTPPTEGQFVGVTGISSTFTDGTRILPLLRPRRQDDMQTF